MQQHPDLEKLLHAINESYTAFERDKELADRAFRISEEEYIDINKQLSHEIELKKLSVKKLKEAIGTIQGGEKTDASDDLLIIARYLNQQVNKRKNAELIFSSLITNMQSAVLLEDETRHIVFTNQHFCDMFAIPAPPAALEGMDCSDSAEQSKHIFKDPEAFVKGINTILKNKQLVTGEILELADGRVFERDYIPIFLEKKYKGHFWSYSDISEKKKSQDLIARSELTNRLILNAALDGIVIINEKSEITFWNPQTEKIFGWTEAEILGRTLTETIIPVSYRDAHIAGMAHYLRTSEGPILSKIIEVHAVDKNGHEFPIELSIIPVKQEGGNFFCAFIRDISARKKAEADLKASQEIWQFALEGAGDGVWEFDFETDEVFFSKQYKKMLGYEDDEFANESYEWLRRIHPEDMHIIEQTDKDYYENKITSHQREYRIKHKDGHFVWILDRGMVIGYTDDGKPKRIIGTHTNITARREAEEEYRRISVVASANENGIVFTDRDGKIFWNNEGFSKLTGYTTEECTGKTPLELCRGPLSNKALLQQMVTAFNEGRNFNMEIIHYRKDGSWFWGRVQGQVTLDENGEVQQYFAMIENINQEKDQEEQIRSLAENIPGVLYRYEYYPDGTEAFVYISPDAEKKIGITEEQLKDFYGILHPDDREREREITRISKAEKAPYQFEGRFQVPGKPVIWLNVASSYSHTTHEGNIVHMGIIINTTREKEAELALQIKEEKYRSIIANMNLGLMEVDNEENIQFVNQSFCEMCGYSTEELIGHKASALFVRGENQEYIEMKNDMRKKGVSDAYEISVRNKRGEIKWWLISGAPRYNDKGELVGSIGIHLDITEQKQLELELIEAREQAESSATAKQTFLANMSHEIRTPMNAILGMTNQLGKTRLNKDQHFYLDTIHSAADNLLIIINDILDLSKIDAGKLTLEKIGFEPRAVIDRIMQVMLHRAEEKGLKFTNSFCDKNLSPVLIGDPYRLNQIMLNLVSNAIKFTHKGGVDISCSVVDDLPHRQTVRITVTDTGIGMDASFAKQLFQQFSQEDSSVIRKYGGTGLGMSICKELVDLMGGSIEVQSKKNEGTSILVTITLEKGVMADLPLKEVVATDTALLAGKKILVTDDNEMNQLVASTILKNYGAAITTAFNGAEAIEKIKETDFDIVLMDVQMPVMDGIEATKQIRQHISKTLPVIALTAFAISGDNQKCLDAGMSDYLSKPFEEKQLLNIVSKWLGRALQQAGQVTAPAAEQSLYSLSKLNEIARGNKDFIDKMVNLFTDQVPAAVKEIEAAYLNKDFEQVKKLAHRIKPSIDNMGIQSLTTEIRQIETMAAEKQYSGELQQLILHLDQVIQKVVAAIRADRG